ncbi:MAG: endolytic transglycosylase MltG [Sneathiellales bacterium]|nr:endolytic transglycosylase MltG [Sneathiellales bacterium]
MKRFFFFVLALFLLFNIALGGLAAYGWDLFTKAGPLQQDKVILLAKGSGLRGIARQLKSEDIIHNELAFIFGVRLSENGTALKAGEFNIPAGLSAEEVMDLLVEGKAVVHSITVPEGLQSREIKALIAGDKILIGELTEEMPEGSVLPETYHFSRGDSRNDVVRRMKEAMRKALEELWKKKSASTPVSSIQDLVTLASIVEKETGQASERGKVAGVFANRLKKKMRLQSDPTVIYGVTKGQKDLGRSISKKDLAAVNDYNTYVIAALPPGPICNPGLESLKATLAPEKTRALYFVADGTGGHLFANSLTEHNRNVRKWRKIEKQRKARQ